MSQGSSPIFKLPNELMDKIAFELPPSSATCFALCNKRLLDLRDSSGKKCLESIKSSSLDEKVAFLSSLEKDLQPDKYFVCHSCIQIHLISSIGWPYRQTSYLKSSPDCTRRSSGRDYGDVRMLWVDNPISLAHVQLATKEYRYVNKFPLDAFKCLKVQYSGSTGFSANDHITLVSTDAQIVTSPSIQYIEEGHHEGEEEENGEEGENESSGPYLSSTLPRSITFPECRELILRSQLWILFPTCHYLRLAKIIGDTEADRFNICAHVHTSDIYWGEVPHRPRWQSSVHVSEMRTCDYCGIDYVVDVVTCEPEGAAIRITKWENLGSGLDPMDKFERWKLRRERPHQQFEDEAKGRPLSQFTLENRQKLFSKEDISDQSSTILSTRITDATDLFKPEPYVRRRLFPPFKFKGALQKRKMEDLEEGMDASS